MPEDDIRRALHRHGEARARARARAGRETAAIKALAPKAIDAGLSKMEITKLAQITRPTLDAMLK